MRKYDALQCYPGLQPFPDDGTQIAQEGPIAVDGCGPGEVKTVGIF